MWAEFLPRQSPTALCDLNLSWQVVLEKASRGNRIFLSRARAISLLAPLQHWVCLAWGEKFLLAVAVPWPAASRWRAHKCSVLPFPWVLPDPVLGSGPPSLSEGSQLMPSLQGGGLREGGRNWALRAEDLGLHFHSTSSCPGRVGHGETGCMTSGKSSVCSPVTWA